MNRQNFNWIDGLVGINDERALNEAIYQITQDLMQEGVVWDSIVDYLHHKVNAQVKRAILENTKY